MPSVRRVQKECICDDETTCLIFFFSSRRRHTRSLRDRSSDVCSSDLLTYEEIQAIYSAGSLGKCTAPTGPDIFVQPVDQGSAVQGGARFNVIAGGTAPLRYQWTLKIGRASCRERVEMWVGGGAV